MAALLTTLGLTVVIGAFIGGIIVARLYWSKIIAAGKGALDKAG